MPNLTLVIELMKDNPVPVLVTAVVIVAMMVPLAIAATWWISRKLSHLETGETKAHTELHGRINSLEVLQGEQLQKLSDQHSELKETVNRRIDDLKDYLSMLLGRSGDPAAKQQAGD